MSTPERIFEEAAQIIRSFTKDERRLAKLKRKRRRFRRLLRAILAMVIAPLIIIPVMIASGLLLGPHGYEGMFAAPLAVLFAWGVILWWALARRRAAPPSKVAVRADLPQLPAQTEQWLDDQRSDLPWAAQKQLDSLALRIESLTPQLKALDPGAPAAAEVRRLLAEELPELVRGYHKVPRALAQKPLYGGPSPEQQLLEGLETIDRQVARVHEQLATDDLHALATHQRYLDMKYNRKDE
jgi:cell division protein FtsB